MTEMIDLYSMLPSEVESYLISLGEPKFRAKQLFPRLQDGTPISEISNLPKALREKLSSLTVITIAQRVASVMNADRILVLDGGTIAASGTHEELMESSPIYRDIYESQMKNGGAVNE